MKLFKINIGVTLLMLSFSSCFAQVITKTMQHEFSVNHDVIVELDSKYTNIEFELTDDEKVTIDAIMQIEGLPEKKVESYFNKWNFKASKHKNKVIISSLFTDNLGVDLKRSGYYNGYFLDDEKLNVERSEIEGLKQVSKNTQGAFDFDAYIEQGNAYLEQWEEINNEKVGRRWYNKTKEERIQLRKPKKETLRKLDTKQTIANKTVLKSKSKLPSSNVRDLSKRAVVNKTLKIKIPRKARLSIKAKHGKIVLSDTITNLNAELNYVLLQASQLNGSETSIKGAYSNFEINQWNNGSLDVIFSDFVLINKVNNIIITSSDSVISIDEVKESIDAKGNFKMLSIDVSSLIKYVNISVEDSKQVWLKLPKTPYNLHFEGVDSKVIYPEKFTLKTIDSNPRKQIIESKPIKNNGCIVKIKALSSVMQIYDVPWENLKIKSL